MDTIAQINPDKLSDVLLSAIGCSNATMNEAGRNLGEPLLADHVDKRKRSEIMAKVRSRDTEPEMRVRRSLHRAGFRYRLHPPELPGRPDLLFPRHRIALFVHGCFWHSHGCNKSQLPKSNVTFWSEKIQRNVSRDLGVRHQLEQLGWKWRVIWQCELMPGLTRISAELGEKQQL